MAELAARVLTVLCGIFCGHQCVKVLLEAKADPNVPDLCQARQSMPKWRECTYVRARALLVLTTPRTAGMWRRRMPAVRGVVSPSRARALT